MLTSAFAPNQPRFFNLTMPSAPHAMSLADLPQHAAAIVSELRAPGEVGADPALIQRLIEVGFVPGERLKVVAFGHPGRDPIAVRIGSTTFALRRFEAQCVLVVPEVSNR